MPSHLIQTLIELFRLAFALQSLAVDPTMAFSDAKRIVLHNLVAKYMNLAAQLMANPSLCQHVQQVGRGLARAEAPVHSPRLVARAKNTY